MTTPCRVISGYSVGIGENMKFPFRVVSKNLESIKKLMDSAEWNKIERVCFLGSSCMYPLAAPQPYREEYLGTGKVEETSSPYAYSKLMAWQLCKAINIEFGYQYFIAIPGDIYGDPKDNHFISDLIKKFHEAKVENKPIITLWGTGSPIRQPMFIDDFENALQFVCENYKEKEPINIAPTDTYSVGTMARTISDIMGYKGDIEFDCKYPDGQMRKTLDNTKLTELGFSSFMPLRNGLIKSYARFLTEIAK